VSQRELASNAAAADRATAHELSYRADIDGLRAVAVLSVVIFHAAPHRVPGGFAGVDIFFVISGYLISGIIYQGLQRGSFSYLDFYARRIRRIFPALIIVLSATLLAGGLWMFPNEFQELGRQTVAGAGFMANILFWSEAGYFDAASQAKPLLHLWSLGIEEQFYLVWPLLLAFLYPRTRRLGWIIAGVALASFACSVLTLRSNPVAAFYSPVTRFWELLVGALLAYATSARRVSNTGAVAQSGQAGSRSRVANEGLAWLGLALIIGSLLLLDESQPFPGWRALVPTLGAACLIAGRGAWLNVKVLSNPLMVLVGVISYPLYLWHWALFTMVQHSRLQQPGGSGHLVLVLLSFALAALTYELIEKPLRFGRAAPRSPAPLLIVCGAVAAAGAFIYLSDGIAFRYPASVRPLATFNYDAGADYREDVCEIDPDVVRAPFRIDPRCIDAPARDAPLLVLWGDSHAASLYQGLRTLQEHGAHIRIAQVTAGACPPLMGGRYGKRANCQQYTEQMFESIKLLKPRIVVLGGAWTGYTRRAGSSGEELQGLRKTIENLRQAGVERVVVFGSLPLWTIAQPNVALKVWQETGHVPLRTYSYSDRAAAPVDALVGEVAAAAGAVFVSPIASLCTAEGCLLTADPAGVMPVTWDTNHLTRAGSNLLVRLNEASILGSRAPVGGVLSSTVRPVSSR
jgi:peptidoglycan/LPS O-acetylase OafA/YrhL